MAAISRSCGLFVAAIGKNRKRKLDILNYAFCVNVSLAERRRARLTCSSRGEGVREARAYGRRPTVNGDSHSSCWPAMKTIPSLDPPAAGGALVLPGGHPRAMRPRSRGTLKK